MPVAGKESVVGDASSSAAAEAKVGTSRSAARAMRARRGTERRRRGIGAFLLRGYCPIGIGTPRLKPGKITAIQHPPLEVLTCEGIVRAPPSSDSRLGSLAPSVRSLRVPAKCQ